MKMRHDNLADLKPGETCLVNGKLYGRCAGCRRVIRVDGLFGGLHWCAP